MWALIVLNRRDEAEDDGSAYINLPDHSPPPEPRPIYVHPHNWRAFQLFEELRTQWRLAPAMGALVFQGLDYPSVIALLDITVSRRSRRRTLFRQIRLLEAGALSVINHGPENLSDHPADPG